VCCGPGRGGNRTRGVSLQVPADHFDVAVLFSVFTRMLIDDIKTFLCLLMRHLAPSKRTLVTAYVQVGVPEQTENPIDWPAEHVGPLHRVLLERNAFEQRVNDAGIEIRDFQPQRERRNRYVAGQPTYLLARPAN
jgi:hypothetical protein